MPAWQDRAAWRVLDTDFADGSRFLAQWMAWHDDPARPALLHYVALQVPGAPDASNLSQRLRTIGSLAVEADGLARQWPGSAPGFHRIELSAGRVLLTLCTGSLPALLREQQFVADELRVTRCTDATGGLLWDRWTVKALTRLCRRGTTLEITSPPAAVQDTFTEAGFRLDPAAGGNRHGRFDPRWEPGRSRHRWRGPAPAASDCAIVGAGLAGAAAAASLARRGWRVTVLDAAASPACGASGLPAGLMAPQWSRDDNARSRLSRAGVRMTLQWCRALLREGEDWAHTGVRQLFPGEQARAPVWHPDAAWIKPSRLVHACLALPGVQFVGHAQVHRAVRRAHSWVLLDAAGGELARASQLVLAAADRSVPLLGGVGAAAGLALPGLQPLKPMQTVGGQVSWGWQGEADAGSLPEVPVNGHGHFVSGIPMEGARAWFLGASYETAAAPRRDEATSHAENRRRLAQLLPRAEQALAARFDAGQVQSWHGFRCTTGDRLPAIGPLQNDGTPCLWMTAGMGSRGLSYAVLGAELIAAQLGGEPLPVEGSLARLLAATRPGLSDHL